MTQCGNIFSFSSPQLHQSFEFPFLEWKLRILCILKHQEELERSIHKRSLRGRSKNLACQAGSSFSCTKPHFRYNFFAGSLSMATWTYRSLIPMSLATVFALQIRALPRPFLCNSPATHTLLKYPLAKSAPIPFGFIPAISSGSLMHWLMSRVPTTTRSALSWENLQEVLKSYATFETSENGRMALMQETLPKPTLFPAIRSVSASNSRSVRYFVWSCMLRVSWWKP